MKELKKKDFEVVGCKIKEKEIMGERNLSYWQSVKIKFFKNKFAILATIILLAVILMTIFSPLFTKTTIETCPLRGCNVEYQTTKNRLDDLMFVSIMSAYSLIIKFNEYRLNGWDRFSRVRI